MASLKDIRRRIGSVKNTQQITKAMKMVSASKLRRAQQAISSARPFAQKLEEITARILTEIEQGAASLDDVKRTQLLTSLHPLLMDGKLAVDENGNEKKQKVALVVVSSDRGLCGAYNSNAVKFATKTYKELSADGTVDVELYYVGRKAYEVMNRRGMKGEWVSDFWAGKFTTAKSDKLAKTLTDKFLSGKVNAVHVCYTQFRSAISQTVETKVLLPLKFGPASATKAVTASSVAGAAATSPAVIESHPFLYEPNRETILASLLPSLVKTTLYRLFADSLASEYGSRMTSMDNASRNAGQMISKLTLEANRVRQAAITKELMEIVGGAEALKG